jgi:Flp pilus assembly protein TadG
VRRAFCNWAPRGSVERAARKMRSCESGAAAIELALTMPLFITLMLGICEYARFAWTYEAVQEAAFAGARCIGMTLDACSVNGAYSQSSAIAFIQSEAQKWGIMIPATNVRVSTATSCNGVSGFSQVELTYTFESFVPGLVHFLPTGRVITGSTCFPG